MLDFVNILLIFMPVFRVMYQGYRKKFISFLFSECPSIKSLSLDMLNYPIYQYPGENISLSSLYELNFDMFNYEGVNICKYYDDELAIMRSKVANNK